ncbi:MAG: DUF4230 domain-containing protein [Lachnospiraceae bacterium]|nr:DUF4230 domain-containing protein [Lachnospiraceae bacterium]
MKRLRIKAGIILAAIGIMTGCGKEEMIQQPEVEQIRSICELSTLQCVYRNVAKAEKSKGEGLAHIGEKERKYWVEYSGTVKLGIDMSKVSMRIEGTDVYITIPDAEVQSMNKDDASYNEDSVISSADGFFNKNKITVEEQQQAVVDAQEKMKETVLANKDLLNKAKERAKTLIENYIKNLGQTTGVTYNVIWEEVEQPSEV